jgi:uncharacterized protein YggU (UPF0235/DUF167 family)
MVGSTPSPHNLIGLAKETVASGPPMWHDGGVMKKGAFYAWDGETLVLNILGTPGAKRDAIGKVKGHQLCVSVTELPRAGRATDHMVRFLAEELGVAISDIEVVFGRMNVNKKLRIKAPTRLPSVIPPR